jgi:hypothetical protein
LPFLSRLLCLIVFSLPSLLSLVLLALDSLLLTDQTFPIIIFLLLILSLPFDLLLKRSPVPVLIHIHKSIDKGIRTGALFYLLGHIA